MPAPAVEAGLRAVVQAGATSPELVAIEARKAEMPGAAEAAEAADPEPAPCAPADAAARGSGAPPASNVLTLRPRIPALPADHRPPPSVAAYDQLLILRSKGSSA
jgi:hypothetical protein